MIDHKYRIQLNRMMLQERYGNLSKWQQLGMDALNKHSIVLEPDSVCWGRTHAHTDSRVICKAELPKSRSTLFLLLHEIGHIVHPRANYKGAGKQAASNRAEAELNATQWAKDEMRAMGIAVPRRVSANYDAYIQQKLDRGIRRGLVSVPASLRKFKKASTAHKHKWEPTHNGWKRCVICDMHSSAPL